MFIDQLVDECPKVGLVEWPGLLLLSNVQHMELSPVLHRRLERPQGGAFCGAKAIIIGEKRSRQLVRLVILRARRSSRRRR